MTNVFLKIAITSETVSLNTLKTYEVANPFSIIDNPAFIINDIELSWNTLMFAYDGKGMEVEFTVRDYDNVVIYRAKHVDINTWELEYVPRVIDAEAILKSIKEIEHWAGNAYQDGDEVDLALINIRKEIGAPR